MKLHYAYFSGIDSTAETALKKSVTVYANKYQHVKIGITNNPEISVKEHQKNGAWKHMIVKYYTTSEKYINEMERTIIAHRWDHVENEISCGESPIGSGPYYLYVLLG